MNARQSWVSIVGYQHEVVHTGVLRNLLERPVVGVRLARELTGADVVAVRNVRQESKVPGYRGKADLVADLELATGGTVALAVETKIDSDASRAQLRATVGTPHFGVLLAVGLTAFKLGQSDLGPELAQWRAIHPSEWLRLLDGIENGGGEGPLRAYVDDVRREVGEHAAAVELAQEPTKPAPRLSTRRREDGYLEDFAWLSEVRAALEHPNGWATKTSRSGPLMSHRPLTWQRDDRVDRYLEFVCFGGGRFFSLKAGRAQASGLGTVPQQLRHAAEPLGWEAPRRRHGPSAKSCTAAWLDLTLLTPGAAAERTRAEIMALSDAL